VRFWDSSAIVPLVVAQPSSAAVDAELDSDPSLIAWWATNVECVSAIARLEREGRLDATGASAALVALAELTASWREVEPSGRVRQMASRLLRVHVLRASDALQLAAAIVAADGDPHTLPFVTLDDRLALAADKEGFPVIVPGAEG
jgi:uncharacterized protein